MFEGVSFGVVSFGAVSFEAPSARVPWSAGPWSAGYGLRGSGLRSHSLRGHGPRSHGLSRPSPVTEARLHPTASDQAQEQAAIRRIRKVPRQEGIKVTRTAGLPRGLRHHRSSDRPHEPREVQLDALEKRRIERGRFRALRHHHNGCAGIVLGGGFRPR